jgi:BirA family biotin operon repressor/biotin-[acetyl-CoA-carboxylase] ligase
MAPITTKTVIIARQQTNGYGRSDHTWESSNSLGLWMSAMLKVNVPMIALSQSTLVLAVAIQHAVKESVGINLQIKWPNDLFSGDRKCAGLLVEVAPATNDADMPTLILGIGLNINQSAEDFSSALNGKAASLSMLLGRSIDKTQLLQQILCSIDAFFAQWQSTGFASIRDLWLAHSYTIGRKVRFQPEDRYGIAIGMSATGALEVQTENGAIATVDCGEIFFES